MLTVSSRGRPPRPPMERGCSHDGYLFAILITLISGCTLCNPGADPCCESADSGGCAGYFANEAACSASGGNFFATASDGAPLCELSDGGTGSP